LKILIVDDDPGIQLLLSDFLAGFGHEEVTVGSGEEALVELNNSNFDVVFLDLMLPGIGGIEVLREIKSSNPGCEVIIITGHGSASSAIQALNLGAYAYINKPFDFQELDQMLNRVKELIELRHGYRLLAQERLRSFHFDNLIAVSPKMVQIKHLAKELTMNSDPLLIMGEPGTGKRFLARLLHFNGLRGSSLLLQMNGQEIENWLREGYFLHMNGISLSTHEFPFDLQRQGYGTIILNQLGDLSIETAERLNKMLSDRLSYCASHGDQPGFRIFGLLETTGAEASLQIDHSALFRPHFKHSIEIPPLRERVECILPITQLFFQRHVADLGGNPFYIAKPVAEFLQLYQWPGNIRELEHMVDRLTYICTSRLVSVKDIQAAQLELAEARRIHPPTLETLLTKAERQLMIQTFRPKSPSRENGV
jgi:DNA-binding NtrC family response regulator